MMNVVSDNSYDDCGYDNINHVGIGVNDDSIGNDILMMIVFIIILIMVFMVAKNFLLRNIN